MRQISIIFIIVQNISAIYRPKKCLTKFYISVKWKLLRFFSWSLVRQTLLVCFPWMYQERRTFKNLNRRSNKLIYKIRNNNFINLTFCTWPTLLVFDHLLSPKVKCNAIICESGFSSSPVSLTNIYACKKGRSR